MCLSYFMSDDEEQVGAGAGELEAQAAASLSLRKAPRLTVAAVRDQMVAEIAQLRQDNREMAKVVTAAVLDALRGQVQQLHQGQGQFAGVEEAGRRSKPSTSSSMRRGHNSLHRQTSLRTFALLWHSASCEKAVRRSRRDPPPAFARPSRTC